MMVISDPLFKILDPPLIHYDFHKAGSCTHTQQPHVHVGLSVGALTFFVKRKIFFTIPRGFTISWTSASMSSRKLSPYISFSVDVGLKYINLLDAGFRQPSF